MTEMVAAVPVSPYKGLAPFEDSDVDAMLFFGREREREIITANLMAYRLTILYGASGVGKSSVLRAGVAHHMRRQAQANRERLGHPQLAGAVFGSWSGDPVTALLADVYGSLVRLFGEEVVATPSDELAESFSVWCTQLDCDLYVILDQADEYFLYHDEDDPFAVQFAEAATRGGLRVNFLLAVREDMLAKLDRFKARIPNLLSNYLRLDHLDRESARAAIVGPIDRCNRLLDAETRVAVEPELVDAVLDQTVAGRVQLADGEPGEDRPERPGRVEAPHLQLVMERLWEEERGSGSQTLRLSTLERLGGANEIVRTHLSTALASLGPDEQDLAETLFNYLVTPSGTKVAHGIGDLAQYAAVDEGEVLPVLSTLVAERILRPVTEVGRSNGSRYEIFHDVLAEPVAAWRARHAADRQLVRQRREAERRHRRLLGITVVSLIALGAMTLVTIFALDQRREARGQAERARAGQLAARAASLLDVDPGQSLRLAFAASRIDPSRDSEDALRRALIEHRGRAVTPVGGPALRVTAGRDRVIVERANGAAVVIDSAGTSVGRLDHGAALLAADLSGDGRTALTAGRDGTVRRWDVGSGSGTVVASEHGPFRAAALSVDRGVAVTISDAHIRFWDLRRRIFREVQAPAGNVFARVSSDGRLALVGLGGREARVYRMASGRLVARLRHPGLRVASFAPAGAVVATGGGDEVARVWDFDRGRQPVKLEGHEGDVVDVEFDAGGERLVTAGHDGAARVWNVSKGELVSILSPHRNPVTAAAFGAGGSAVVTASTDGLARLWWTSDGRQAGLLAGHDGAIRDVAFMEPGRIVTTSVDGTVRIWDGRLDPALTVVRPAVDTAPKARLVLDLSPDGRRLAAGGLPGVALWRFPTSTAAAELVAVDRTAAGDAGLRFSGRSLFVASAGEKGVSVSTFGTDMATVRLDVPSLAQAVALGADRLVATVATATPRRIDVWRRGGVHAGRLRAPTPVSALAFSADGRRIAAGGESGTAWILDRTSGEVEQELSGHTSSVMAASFTRDGRFAATASRDGDARIWAVDSGELLHTLQAHFGPVSDVAFSPDGRWLVTAGPLAAAVWDVTRGQQLFYLRGHTGVLTGAAFGPGGRIVTAGEDGTVRTYICRVCAGVEQLQKLAQRPLTVVR